MTDALLMNTVGVVGGILLGQFIWHLFCPEDDSSESLTIFLFLVFAALFFKGVI